MKNAFKTGLAALAIAISITACGGGSSSRLGDSTQTDSSTRSDTSAAGNKSGANGSTAPMDTGMDRSGSGGTDTAKLRDSLRHP